MSQLKSIANSKDLRPWWNPFSSKIQVRNNLLDILGNIEESWGPALDEGISQAHSDEIDKSVLAHIRQTRNKQRYRVYNRWRKGLRWKFLLSGVGNTTVGVNPLIEMGHFYV